MTDSATHPGLPERPRPSPRLIVLDRDGVILRHVSPYILGWDDVHFVAGAVPAAAAFARAGARLAIATNQSPIGRGLVSRTFVDEVNEMLVREFDSLGVPVVVYVCPHVPDDGCDCRKPAPGLILRAARDCNVHPADTWMVGDHDTDALAGLAAGCGGCIHLLSGRQEHPSPHADMVADDLASLAHDLLAEPFGR